MIYSKTMHPIHYMEMDEHKYVQEIATSLYESGVPYRFEHPHRAWEYGIALNALKSKDIKTVLDVGGGGSVFAAAAASLGIDVLQVDPGNVGNWITRQEMALGIKLPFEQVFFEDFDDEVFDAVTCLSVLEHIPGDLFFFEKMLLHAAKMIVVTVDFSPTGKAVVDGHIRTYNEDMMVELIGIGRKGGFELLGRAYDYSHPGDYVYGYNFASLVMERKDGTTR